MARESRSTAATVLALFCAGTVIFLVYRDLFIPQVRDTEVWFGFEVHGWLAWLTAPIHWAIFVLFAWGFWTNHPNVWGAARIYAAYIALSHLVWNLTSPIGGGWSAGILQFALFCVPVGILWAIEE